MKGSKRNQRPFSAYLAPRYFFFNNSLIMFMYAHIIKKCNINGDERLPDEVHNFFFSQKKKLNTNKDMLKSKNVLLIYVLSFASRCYTFMILFLSLTSPPYLHLHVYQIIYVACILSHCEGSREKNK